MKMVMITNILIKVSFIVCVTILSIVFNKVSLLWWFLLLPFLGYEYRTEKDKPTEKGGVKQ